MGKCKITLLKKHFFPELVEEYALNGELTPCQLLPDDYSVVLDTDSYMSLKMPEGFCSQAWDSISAYVYAAVNCGCINNAPWMKNPRIYIGSCNDGLRPVSFRIEALEE